MKKFNDRIID